MMVLNTYEMRRLSGLSMLGFVKLVYPCANHTRFEHSLGVLHTIDEIVRRSQLPLDSDDIRTVRLAALLHDVSHMPFSHVSERVSEIDYEIPKHDSREVLEWVFDGNVLEEAGKDDLFPIDSDLLSIKDVLSNRSEREELVDIICSPSPGERKKNPILHELIAGPISADILDYIRRDSFYLGLPYGMYDDRILSSFNIVPTDGGRREGIAFNDSFDSRHSCLSVLAGRCSLFTQALRHHTSMIADRMFFEILHFALEFGAERNEWKKLFVYDDGQLWDYLSIKSGGQLGKSGDSGDGRPIREAARLISDLKARRLYKRAFMASKTHSLDTIRRVFTYRDENFRELRDVLRGEIKESTGKELGVTELIIDSPTGKSKWKEDYMSLKFGIEGKTIHEYPLERNQLESLRHQYESLETLGIYFRPFGNEVDLQIATCVSDYCQEQLGWRGYHKPKPALSQEYSTLKLLVQASVLVFRNKKWAKKLLQAIANSPQGVTRDKLSKMLRFQPTTISAYVGILKREFEKSGLEILSFERIGGRKVWKISPRFRNLVKAIL